MAIILDANGNPINSTENSGAVQSQAQGGVVAPTSAPNTPPVPQPKTGPGEPTTLNSNPLDYWSRSSQNPYSNGLNGNLTPQSAAWGSYMSTFGRPPTQAELAQALPAFQDGRVTGGAAFVANLYQQQQNSPQNIYNQQQSQYTAAAPQYADSVNQAFKTNLGRDATADEKTHFGALIASGQDPYQVQQALQQTQEYQNKQNTDFQNKLQGQLQDSNTTYFQNHLLPAIQAQATSAGRSLDSSGVNSAMASAGLQQNQQLQQFLAGVTAQNYGNSTANATNQYQNLQSQQYGLQNAGVSNTLANNSSNNQYSQNLNMYQLQQQAYNNYLGQYGKRNNGLGGAIGGVLGAGIGGAFGGTAGASAGYGIGSGLGNAGQSAFSGGKI